MAKRRPEILMSLYLDVASKNEVRKVEDLLLAGHKGPAEMIILRKIRKVWLNLINGYPEKNKPERVLPHDDFDIPNLGGAVYLPTTA